MKSLRLIIFAGVVMAVLAIGCRGVSSDYSEFRELPERGWAYGDTVSIADRTADSLPGEREMTVAVVHSNTYPYSNLWLELTYADAAGRQYRDTVEMTLADDYGHWLGNGIGERYQSERTVRAGVNLPQRSDVKIRHVMRVDTLRGIEKIGLTIRKAR